MQSKMAANWLWTEEDETQKQDSSKEQEELFVFGYACKIFRDDEKAVYIDSGRHLIPWMGDDRLMIDRYDGRGHLYDLSAYDASNLKPEDLELSEKEKHIEAACDEERYLELHTDVAEAEMYQEEEWKRYYESLQEGYKAVGFSYEQPGGSNNEETEQESVPPPPEDLPFEVCKELQVPPECEVPTTQKQNAIIEKTARFTAQHGAQMEIILKIKQGGNPQFKFLSFEDPLNAYYKHVVQMIKSGKYKPKLEIERQNSSEDEAHHAHGYLHPILSSTATAAPPVSKPIQMPKVCVHTTSYGQLIKSITKSRVKNAEKQKLKMELENRATPPPLDPPPVPPFMNEQPYNNNHSGLPPPPGTEPVVLPTQNEYDVAKSEILHHSDIGLDHTPTPSTIVPPPPDIQPIIDRMAMYVAKNGVEFEMVVKSKKDERFAFLLSDHVHFRYYDFKKCLFLEQMETGKKQKSELESGAAQKGVSFSIKMRPKEQESVTQLRKPLFDYGSSEEEHEGESDGQREKSEISRSSTPVSEAGQGSETRIEIPPEILEKKLAEEKLKDRLATVAREKLTQANKEKQMQAERKRKAAMFINQLKSSGPLFNSDLPVSPLASRSSTPGLSSSKDSLDTMVSEYKRIDYHHGKSRSTNKSRSRSPLSYSRRSSRSPSRRARRRSPTPPTAFSNARWSRSKSPPSRRSPPPSEWWPLPNPRSTKRSIRSPPHRQSSRSRERSISKKHSRSKSRSPSSKSKKHKKHDRSPKKKKKDKDRSREKDDHGKHKSKEKKDKRKDRHKDSKSKSKLEEEKIESDRVNQIVIVSDEAECDDEKTPMSSEHELNNVVKSQNNEHHSPVGPRTPDEPTPLSDVDNTNSNGALDVKSVGNSNTNSGRASPAVKKVDAPVSQHLLSRVREILKASRDCIKLEEGLPNS